MSIAFDLITAPALAEKALPDVSWLVDGLLPQGVAILGAPPKSYKSWMALDLCIAVARGTDFLQRPTHQAHALYMDLESGERRPKDRMAQILAGQAPPHGLFVATALSGVRRIGDGYEEQLGEVLDADPELKLVVVDVLKCIRPTARCGQLAYDADYATIRPLTQLAADHPGVCIMLVTHDRKLRDTCDWTNNLSGSTGLTGAVDVIWRIDKDKREASESTLRVTGRDIEPQDLQMQFDIGSMRWRCLGTVDAVQADRLRRDYAQSAVVKTIKRGLDVFAGVYQTSATEMAEASKYWGCQIHADARMIGVEVDKYEALLLLDGIACTRVRATGKSRKRSYEFRRRP